MITTFEIKIVTDGRYTEEQLVSLVDASLLEYNLITKSIKIIGNDNTSNNTSIVA